ncbi:isocitrate lyase/PEP mutase family protein [Microvirga terrestris]|uniref:Isocitrate lyase/phosphoenolpyruvate mutase family protein n=1 Tax=Microvirga terrestris TaxID=2791024 RepID=A0ABS0HLZ0_9HYPH|nr:isocitrate lyase/phosphoenolpyruvate mutase family protein [Microvirga terrestris]MBF9194496.1 isocitrate lyase/phosphoenolpyruvate mutase family protein [Microvirga terrestris]
MSDQVTKAQKFKTLHVPGHPIILFNIWDAGTAKAVAASGAKALATGSWSVAAAHGFEDGEHMPFDLALANLERITAAMELPVTIDLESGYSVTPDGVGMTVARALEAGAIGCNLEDSARETGPLRTISEQAARLKGARHAADRLGIPAFLNARTDVFLIAPADTHEGLVAEALERARAYADAGADGFFVPGLVNEALIARVVEGSSLPVNVMFNTAMPPAARLAELGVARISHGPGPYRMMMKALESAAREALL